VVVGTDVRGTLVKVAVEEKQLVKRGQLLAELRADDLRASVAEARAHVAEAEADIHLYELEVAREEKLVARQVEPEANADRARRNRDAAVARRATATAEVTRLEAELAKTRITAPIDGVVIVKHVHSGETVDAGAPLVEIADLRRVRVEAEVDEFDAGRVALGAPVAVHAEGFGTQSWTGRVEEIPDAVSARRLKPQDPGKPQDTRVLIVKVALATATPLKLGQRVEVEIGG
jgi:RND family efflux transporter MFP subunit